MEITLKRLNSTVDDIYETLSQRIISGFYLPGLKMTQLELAADLNVSRTPLREALNRLQADKLVVNSNTRGVEVAGIHLQDTEQHYAVRLMIEPSVVVGICGDFTQEDFQAMRQALDQMDANRDRTKDYQSAHHRFHEIALSKYPSMIREIVETAYLKIERHQRLYFTRPHAADDFIDIDRLYLDALELGDSARARALLEFHLIDAALGLLRDADPDHKPSALLIAAQGVGIDIECDSTGIPTRPAKVRWVNRAMPSLPILSTSNLELVVDPSQSLKEKS